MLNIVDTPSNFHVYFDTVQNFYVVKAPYERTNYPSYLQKDPVRYQKLVNFAFDDELIFDSFQYCNTVKGATLKNRMGRKFHFHLKDFQKLLLSDRKFVGINGELIFPGRYTFKRRGSNNFCTLV